MRRVVAVRTAAKNRNKPNAYRSIKNALIKKINEKNITDLAIPVVPRL